MHEVSEAASNTRFWLFYTAAWLLYAVSLGILFIGVGYQANLNLLVQISGNVAPAFLLGIGIVFVCRRLIWNDRSKPLFILIHLIYLLLFPVCWTFLTLLNFSVLNFLKNGTWNFVTWDKYGLQWQFFIGLMAYLTIASAVYVGETNANWQTEIKRSAELELRAARAEAARNQAELVALRAQLNPHFLFNTLHSLMALVRTDASKAEEAIERFALMLRYVLQAQIENRAPETDATFADEWRFIQNYLDLESLRLGNRLKVEADIENEALNFKLPAFIVQPLVENAIKHAVAPQKDGAKICIKAQVFGERLRVEVSDDGKGANVGEVGASDGLGLRLVRESLAARFGKAASFDYQSAPGKGFAVSLEIPKRADGNGNSV